MLARLFLLIGAVSLVAAAGVLALDRLGIVDVPSLQRFFAEWKNRAPLPEAQPYRAAPLPLQEQKTAPAEEMPQEDVAASSSPTPVVEPAETNLAIPFTSQAPFANWDEVHEDFCEEASVLMAASYIRGTEIPDPAFADAQMFAIKAFEEQRFGYFKDTTAEETATILREFYGIERVAVRYEPTITMIREALALGKAVVAPAAGRQLGNPYFTPPGPLYHMLVIKGYTKDGRFITNDPGTRRGANYLYDSRVLLNAIHDWNGGDVDNGRKVIIIVG